MVDARSENPRVLSVATAVPPHRVEQGEIKEFARRLFGGKVRDLDRLLPVFDNGQIETRHFCRPLEWFGREWTFPERNALYVEHALELSEKAARRCLDRAGVKPTRRPSNWSQAVSSSPARSCEGTATCPASRFSLSWNGFSKAPVRKRGVRVHLGPGTGLLCRARAIPMLVPRGASYLRLDKRG